MTIEIKKLLAKIVNTNNYENLSKDIHEAINELARCDAELDILHNLITEKYEECMPDIKLALEEIDGLTEQKVWDRIFDYICSLSNTRNRSKSSKEQK